MQQQKRDTIRHHFCLSSGNNVFGAHDWWYKHKYGWDDIDSPRITKRDIQSDYDGRWVHVTGESYDMTSFSMVMTALAKFRRNDLCTNGAGTASRSLRYVAVKADIRSTEETSISLKSRLPSPFLSSGPAAYVQVPLRSLNSLNGRDNTDFRYQSMVNAWKKNE